MSETTEPRLLILEYHRVSAEGSERLRPWRIEPALFAAQMRHVATSGMRVLTPSQWFEDLPGGASVAITFDDAYEDFASHAWPVLGELGLTPEVYVPTRWAGGRSEWDGMHDAAPLMSWSRMREMHRLGVSFQSHGHTHVRLAQLEPGRLADELELPIKILQAELGTRVDTVAYPYGVHDARVHAAAKSCGYRLGLTVEMGYCSRGVDSFQMPRFEVLADCDLRRFEQALAAFAEVPR
jgi:peptidoglycan/xylan/chitin deacetylase (PgdA/CDA1 family)